MHNNSVAFCIAAAAAGISCVATHCCVCLLASKLTRSVLPGFYLYVWNSEAALTSQTLLQQVPRRVQVVAPKQLPVFVRSLSAGWAPDGASGSPGTSDGAPGTPRCNRGTAAGSHKVAPGMEAVFAVSFCPEDDQDFACGLLVVTEREAFEVPVLGTGAAQSTRSRVNSLHLGRRPCPWSPQGRQEFCAGCWSSRSAKCYRHLRSARVRLCISGIFSTDVVHAGFLTFCCHIHAHVYCVVHEAWIMGQLDTLEHRHFAQNQRCTSGKSGLAQDQPQSISHTA